MTFIMYTKGDVQWVTTPNCETRFLDWLATIDKTSSYERTTSDKVGIQCSPASVYVGKPKESATVLKLVREEQ